MCCNKKYFSLLLNSCNFSNVFIVFGNLLYNFIPTYVLLSVEAVNEIACGLVSEAG